MDKIAKLKLRAVRERDAAIKKARDKCAKRLAELREISRALKQVERRQFSGKSYRQPPAVQCAETVLRECGPMTVQELAVEILARGLRDDEPAELMKNLRASMAYHAGRFWRRGERWKLAD